MSRSTPRSAEDWLRSERWDAEAREQFEARLLHVRKRAAYLRAKAMTLIKSTDPETVAAGQQLLRRLVTEQRHDRLDCAAAYYYLGDSLARSGRRSEAIAELRNALEEEAAVRISHESELRLAEVLIDGGSDAELTEALGLLARAEQLRRGIELHSLRWRLEVAWARALDGRGEYAAAGVHAVNALTVLEVQTPQLHRHPRVGRIEPADATVAEIQALAANAPPR